MLVVLEREQDQQGVEVAIPDRRGDDALALGGRGNGLAAGLPVQIGWQELPALLLVVPGGGNAGDGQSLARRVRHGEGDEERLALGVERQQVEIAGRVGPRRARVVGGGPRAPGADGALADGAVASVGDQFDEVTRSDAGGLPQLRSDGRAEADGIGVDARRGGLGREREGGSDGGGRGADSEKDGREQAEHQDPRSMGLRCIHRLSTDPPRKSTRVGRATRSAKTS
ncbi:hypothetical protein GALL_448330 [mine drainage metagenome]|uniref:Uncharacterized protein n=1 Tax=mine drainage metagenome TaxID=410659 RepID=A0A1J5Q7T3_9ZZZZ